MRKKLVVRRSWKDAAKRLVCAASAAGLMAAMVPAGAFATDAMSTYYKLPTKDDGARSFEHVGHDNGHDYTYEYVTIGSSVTGRVAPMATTYYETLGLNYINAYTGAGSIFAGRSTAESDLADLTGVELNSLYTSGSIGSLQTKNSTLAITATDNNENPDEYLWNYCVWANGGTVAADSRVVDHGNKSTGAVSVNIGGTAYADFPREVYNECNVIATTSSSDEYAGSTYAKWVELENQRENRPKKGEYDPYFAKYEPVSGGGAAMVRGLYELADTIDGIVAQSRDANGNYTLQSRYGGNTADGTGAVIAKYEDFVQATQYYTMSKIADGTVKRAVTADLVGYDPETGNYAVRKYNAAEDPDTNKYGGRVANYLSSISTSMADLGLKEAQAPSVEVESDYVAWYTPKQIVESADAVFVCDAYSANNVSTYLATATDGKCYTVYTPAGVGKDEEDNTEGLVRAQNSAKAAGKSYASFCFSYPANMFGNFYAQGVENGMLAAITSSFTYPKLFDLTDMLAYWVKNIWHIRDSRVNSILSSVTAGMSLSGGAKIGTPSANYEATAEKIFLAGNKYYLANQAKIDAMNGGNLATYSVDDLKARVAAAEKKYPATTPSKPAKVVKTVTVNAKTVTAKAVASAVKKAGGKASTVTSITLGSKVKTVNASAFKSYKKLTKVTLGKNVKTVKKNAFKGSKVKTVVVKSAKLTKKSVKGSLRSSKVKTVKVDVSKKASTDKKYVKKYKKIFTKANAGKKVSVKR